MSTQRIVPIMVAAAVLAAPGAARAQSASPGAAQHEPERDGPRLRGGFNVSGGIFLLPNNPVGGAFSIEARAGVQFNHYISLYYQNTPIVGATASHDRLSGTVVFADDNSLLLGLTLLHMIDIGAGPSLDYIALAHGSLVSSTNALSPSAETGTGLAAGAHGRFAIILGGLSGNGPRRSGFSVSVDAHPMFLGIGRALSLTAGIGAEWF